MKALSSIELHFLEKELQKLVGAKIDKIFQPAKKELLLQLHKQGKVLLHVLPELIWTTQTKQAMPESISGFCAFLRKKLNQTRLKSVQQLKPERVLLFIFEKVETYRLIFELFGNGNIIICDKDGKILAATEMRIWKDRAIKPGEHYKLPKSEYDVFTINQEDFVNVFAESELNISKTLATTLGIGGLYAEEVCIRANIQPNKLNITKEEGILVFQSLQELLNETPKPCIVMKDEKIIDIVPIKLEKYGLLKQKDFESFSTAIDEVISPKLGAEQKSQAEVAYEKQIEKVNRMIEMQKKNMVKLEKNIKDNQKKGEYIYESYQELHKLIGEIMELRKTLSWKELKQKIPQIKDLDEATQSVILEI